MSKGRGVGESWTPLGHLGRSGEKGGTPFLAVEQQFIKAIQEPLDIREEVAEAQGLLVHLHELWEGQKMDYGLVNKILSNFFKDTSFEDAETRIRSYDPLAVNSKISTILGDGADTAYQVWFERSENDEWVIAAHQIPSNLIY